MYYLKTTALSESNGMLMWLLSAARETDRGMRIIRNEPGKTHNSSHAQCNRGNNVHTHHMYTWCSSTPLVLVVKVCFFVGGRFTPSICGGTASPPFLFFLASNKEFWRYSQHQLQHKVKWKQKKWGVMLSFHGYSSQSQWTANIKSKGPHNPLINSHIHSGPCGNLILQCCPPNICAYWSPGN